MKNKSVLGTFAFVILAIGGLNWGLVGLFGFDLVSYIFGDMSTLTRIVYVLVGLSALYKIFFCQKRCCDQDKPGSGM